MNASSSGKASSPKIVTTNSAAEVKKDVSAPQVSSAPREGHRIDPQKTNRIGGLIGREKPAAATVEKQPAVSSSNFTGEGGRAGSSVGGKKSSAPGIDKHTSAEIGGRIGSDKITRIDSSDGGRKPSVSPDVTSSVISPNKTSSIGGPIGKEKGDGHSKGKDAGKAIDKPERVDKNAAKSAKTIQKDATISTRDVGAKTRDISVSKNGPGDRKVTIKNNIKTRIENKIENKIVDKSEGCKARIRRRERVGHTYVGYDDCPSLVDHSFHYDHVYMDYHRRISHRIIWPSYRYLVHYNWGPYGTFRYVYPYHHRKYIFVSLCGYWPAEYTCARYYWYGYHPYAWYGYYPIPYEVQGDTYNYYTYNSYYDNEPAASTTTTTAWPTQTENYIRPVDSNTFADVREKLARQAAAQPDQATLADTYFEEGVKVFEVNDFNAAAVKFAMAMELAPDDMVLPFAYAQALFADGQYTESAQVLRAALVKVSPDKEGVFYPRGLYSGDDILFEQVIRLSEKAEVFSFDADLQLLLGYQLLGLGEVDEASEPLLRAGEDLQNAAAAAVLLKLQEKIKANGAVQGDKQ
jgi:hypothetical protein